MLSRSAPNKVLHTNAARSAAPVSLVRSAVRRRLVEEEANHETK
jgi:hypothetical protein